MTKSRIFEGNLKEIRYISAFRDGKTTWQLMILIVRG